MLCLAPIFTAHISLYCFYKKFKLYDKYSWFDIVYLNNLYFVAWSQKSSYPIHCYFFNKNIKMFLKRLLYYKKVAMKKILKIFILILITGFWVFNAKLSATKGAVGLSNLGNTCFANATLQSMFSLEKFNNKLVEADSLSLVLKKITLFKPDSVAQEYINLFNEYQNASVTVKPNSFCSAMRQMEYPAKTEKGKVAKFNESGRQEDAAELIRMLLRTFLDGIILNYEIATRISEKTAKPETYFKIKETKSIVNNSEIFRQIGESLNNLVSYKFYSTTTCPFCNNESSVEKASEGSDLSLDFPTPIPKSISLAEMFFSNLINEGIIGYKCESCNEVSSDAKPATNYLKIIYLPQYLIVVLNRFISTPTGSSKIDSLVTDISSIDLEIYAPKNSNTKYNLIAITMHSGSLRGGHYTAYGKRNNVWWFFNDFSATQKQSPITSGPDPYVLFYERQITPEEEAAETEIARLKQAIDDKTRNLDQAKVAKEKLEAKLKSTIMTEYQDFQNIQEPQRYFAQVKYLLTQLQENLDKLSGFTAQTPVAEVQVNVQKTKAMLAILQIVIRQIETYILREIDRKRQTIITEQMKV